MIFLQKDFARIKTHKKHQKLQKTQKRNQAKTEKRK